MYPPFNVSFYLQITQITLDCARLAGDFSGATDQAVGVLRASLSIHGRDTDQGLVWLMRHAKRIPRRGRIDEEVDARMGVAEERGKWIFMPG